MVFTQPLLTQPLLMAPSPQDLFPVEVEALHSAELLSLGVDGVRSCPKVANPCFDIEQTRGGTLIQHKVPGTRCPTCALEGKEVWVIPGRYCGYCGTPCDN